MVDQTIFPLNFKPGIKRDDTVFDGEYNTAGQWTRWYRGKAKKMGGYLSVYDQWADIVRGTTTSFSSMGQNYVYGGSKGALQMLLVNPNGTGGAFFDRTPAGFVSDNNNEWSMTSIYDSGGTEMDIVAMAKQTLSDISDTTDNQIYYGNITDTTALTALGSYAVSGGVVALPPYLFIYGNDGYIAWSDKNAIGTIGTGGGDAGEARIAANKIVAAIPLRGGSTNAPAGLFWSLDTLQRISFVGTPTIFRNDTIATDISILSSNAIVDYDGVIFWPGVDRFLSFNGVVQEVPNPLNLDFFYNNYNKSCPQKIWAFKNPRYGEIWWCYPFGNSTECNWAVVYNVRENTWYDTPLPEGGRSAGMSPKSTFPYPLLFGVEPTAASKYNLWMHENGVDKSLSGNLFAIEAFYETGDLSHVANGPLNQGWSGVDRWMRATRMEPDYVLTGALTFEFTGNIFADSPDDTPQIFTYDPASDSTFKIDTRLQYREMRIKVTSNVQGGDFYEGMSILHLTTGDKRASAGQR